MSLTLSFFFFRSSLNRDDGDGDPLSLLVLQYRLLHRRDSLLSSVNFISRTVNLEVTGLKFIGLWCPFQQIYI